MNEYMNDNSAYLQAFAHKKGSDFPEAICNNFQFKYGNITYQDFKKKYSPNGLVGRKFLAIPKALYSGLIKTTIHLVQATFALLRSLFIGYRFETSSIFSAVRDLQESFGHIVSLFNDQYGLYLVEESQFHKIYYSFPFERDTLSGFDIIELNKINYRTVTEDWLSENFPPFTSEVNEYAGFRGGEFVMPTEKKLAALEKENLQAIVERLSPYTLEDIPDSRLKDLNYTGFNHQQTIYLFNLTNSSFLSGEDVYAILDKFASDPEMIGKLIDKITDKQLEYPALKEKYDQYQDKIKARRARDKELGLGIDYDIPSYRYFD